MEYKTTILDELSLNRTIKRLSHEIIEHNNGVDDLILVGIKTRGIPFAHIIKNNIKAIEGIEIPVEEVDITLYRDDLTEIAKDATLNKDEITLDVNG